MTKCHDSKPCCVHLIFVTASLTRGRSRATRVRIGIAGLDCLPHPPGLCFSRWASPQQSSAHIGPLTSSQASPEESLSPTSPSRRRVLFPTSTLPSSFRILSFHGTVSFSSSSFLLFTFFYTASIIPSVTLGRQLAFCAAVSQFKALSRHPIRPALRAPPPFRSH